MHHSDDRVRQDIPLDLRLPPTTMPHLSEGDLCLLDHVVVVNTVVIHPGPPLLEVGLQDAPELLSK